MACGSVNMMQGTVICMEQCTCVQTTVPEVQAFCTWVQHNSAVHSVGNPLSTTELISAVVNACTGLRDL